MKRILNGMLAAIVGLGAYLLVGGAALAATVCPAVGDDTDCSIIITVANSGATVTDTGQGPYDGDDDTIVGVVNNTNKPISSIGLTSNNVSNGGIFGFDDDGISSSSYGLPGNAQDSSQYGGPHGYFTAINTDQTAGIVNFTVPIPPGGSDYFSLENALNNAYACQQIVNNSVTHAASGGTAITATFTPQYGLNTSQAAAFCGFTAFDWIQKITSLPDPTPFYAVNPSDAASPVHLTSASAPFNDPHQNGYTYNPAWNSYPYYWDPNSTSQPWSLSTYDTGTSLSFYDSPADPCLAGGNSTNVKGCMGAHAPAGSVIAFSTDLVGIQPDGTPMDLGIGFTWTDNYNGTSGGVATTASVGPVDPGSGTGSITITGVQNTTSYQYNSGVVVTTVNGNSSSTLRPRIYIPIVPNQSTIGTQQKTSRPMSAIPPTPTPRLLRPISTLRRISQ